MALYSCAIQMNFLKSKISLFFTPLHYPLFLGDEQKGN